jgi:hypothetical protein
MPKSLRDYRDAHRQITRPKTAQIVNYTTTTKTLYVQILIQLYSIKSRFLIAAN